jgi:hypothetical protein
VPLGSSRASSRMMIGRYDFQPDELIDLGAVAASP